METRYLPVLTKKDFVRRYNCGEFGNASKTWQTYRDWSNDDDRRKGLYGNLYHWRNRSGGQKSFYNLPDVDVAHKFLYELEEDDSGWYISAMAPHTCNLLQGEVQLSPTRYDLVYSTAQDIPMRDALASASRYATGLKAESLLRTCLNPVSYDWLQILLERYPEHVVEFSAFSKCWGTLPGYNTVFWEVRAATNTWRVDLQVQGLYY